MSQTIFTRWCKRWRGRSMGFLYRGPLFVDMDIAQAKNSKIAEIESVRRQFKDSYLRLIRALKVVLLSRFYL